MTYQIIIYLHVIAGMTAFASGIIAGFAEKGSKIHMKAGKAFAYLMSFAVIAAIALSILKPNPFLFGIGLFTIYLIASGWLWAQRIPHSEKLKRSKIVGIFGMLSAIYMLITAFGDGFETLNIVLVVFGSILLVFSIIDLIKKVDPAKAMRKHGGRMGGAFIAATTAFIVTNFSGALPNLVLWLGPTVIGFPLITMAVRRYYKKRMARQEMKRKEK